MVIKTSHQFTAGRIIDKTIRLVEMNLVPALIYAAIVCVLGTTVTYIGLTAPMTGGILQLAVFIVAAVAGYLFVETMMKRAGLFVAKGERRFLPYLGMSILVGLGVLAGILMLIIPGLIFLARWSVSNALLIGRGEGATESMRNSWNLTRGHELPIILAALALAAIFIVIYFIPVLLFTSKGLAAVLVSQIGSALMNVVFLAMGVAIYGMISAGQDLSSTFE